MKSSRTINCTIILFLILSGCQESSQPTNIPSQNNSGRVLFSIDKVNAPLDVRTVTTILSRNGYPSKQKVINIVQDTGTTILFDEVETGIWMIQVDAKNDSGKIIYTGKSEVSVFENTISQVNILLTRVSSGMGSIQINIKWGNNDFSEWYEFAANPILNAPSNISMSSGIYLPKVIYENGKYYLWYNMSTSKGGIGFATSVNGVQWFHQSTGSIIQTGQLGAWDGSAIGIGAILYENGIFKMFFNAFDQNKRFRIGYAVSSDGLHWQKNPAPVFEGDTTWSNSTVSCAIIKIDSGYYLYYSACAQNSNKYSIGLAYSSDGLNFKKYQDSPILSALNEWESNSIYWPTVIKNGKEFVMMYMNGTGGTSSAFGIAKSIDGVNWQKMVINPVFSWKSFHGTWSESEIAYPFLFSYQNEIRLYYSGFSSKGYSIGLAFRK